MASDKEELVVTLALRLFPGMVERFNRASPAGYHPKDQDLGTMAMQRALSVAREGVAYLKTQGVKFDGE